MTDAAPGVDPVCLGIAISTIGRRPERLARLLGALADQTDRDVVVGVCDQSDGETVAEVLDRFEGRLDLFRTRSLRGLSAGRNSVIRAAPDRVTHFAFPNDTTVPATDFVGRVKAVARGVDVVACAYVDSDRPRYRLPSSGDVLDPFTVWKVLEPAMVLSRDLVIAAGGFDETLGTGGPTRYQSGEGTDLLLRAMRTRPVLVHWAPTIEIEGVPQDFGLTRAEARRKAREYGRGYGFVIARHPYPLGFTLPHLVSPLARSLLHLQDRQELLSAFASSVGRVEGVLGQRRDDRRR